VLRNRSSLATLVDDFERHGNDVAIVARHGLRVRRVTYAELAQLARRFAAELIARGIGKGDRVILWGENGPEWVAAFFGCVLRGVLPVPIDFASANDFAARVGREVAPKLIVGSASKPVQLAFEDFHTLTTNTAGEVEDLAESDPVQIVFTSGTTGEPKGVVHTHRNVLASLRPIEAEMQKYLKYERIFHPIRILHTLPLSHVFGQFMGLWIPPLLAAEIHYESRLVASDLAATIKRERISVLAAVPRVLDLLQQYLVEARPNLLERISAAAGTGALGRWWKFRDVHRSFGFKFWAFVCGGASLAAASEQFWQALGFVVVQGYGMTETTALVSLNHPFKAARGTIGQVLPGREVRLSDDGEVLVRGETISNSTWQGGRMQQSGSEWLATGDLAEFDAQGNLQFKGRKKDTIVTAAGLNVYPEDLEAALMRQPGVKAAAVIETKTPVGPEPFAAVVLQPGADGASAIGAANRELAEFQQIRHWVMWPDADLPRTSTGKPLKREVSRRVASGELQPAFAIGENLDSLARVELQARLEQEFGIALDDAAIQKIEPTTDINQLVAASRRSSGEEQVYPKWPWTGPMQFIRSVFLDLIAMPLVRFLAKPKVERCVRTFPNEPVLIVANHVTSYDAPLILYALPRRIRNRAAIAMSGEWIMNWRKRRNQGNWFLNLVAPITYLLVTGLFNVFPLPQLSGFRRSFRHAGEAMDAEYNVLVFPEGRRSDDGTPQPFKGGAGLLWKELGTAAVTVRLEGLGAVKARGRRWFRSGTYRVVVVDVLPPQPNKSPEELTDLLARSVFSAPPEQAQELAK
jgi:long-chain acyl-CoA synthetase